MTPTTLPPAVRIAGLVLVLWMGTGVTAAQNPQDDGTASLPPYFFGFNGGISGSETEVRDLRIRFHIPILPVEERRWGLRLRVTVYAGIYDVSIFDPLEFDDITFQSLGATPGVELLLPLGSRWTLKPFVDIGYVRDFETRNDLLLWSAGLRTLGAYEVGRFDLSVGTKIRALSVHTSGLDLEDRFGELMLGFDATRPVPLRIAGNQAEVSGYYIYRHYFDARVNRAESEPLTLDYSHELGVRFGTDPRIKLWFIRLPSIGLGYRWGQNIRGVRLSFGFPF